MPCMQILTNHKNAARALCAIGIAASLLSAGSMAVGPQMAAASIDTTAIGPIATQTEMLQSKELAPGNGATANDMERVKLKAERDKAEKKAAAEKELAQRKAELLTSESLCLSQKYSDGCTLTANAMMLRRASFLKGGSMWEAVDDSSVEGTIWGGAGIPNTYEAFGMTVNYHSLEGGKKQLIELLNQHPEGIAAYDPGVPHAVLLAGYDAENDVFLCADPSAYFSGRIINLADSWNGSVRGSGAAAADGFAAYWSIDE